MLSCPFITLSVSCDFRLWNLMNFRMIYSGLCVVIFNQLYIVTFSFHFCHEGFKHVLLLNRTSYPLPYHRPTFCHQRVSIHFLFSLPAFFPLIGLYRNILCVSLVPFCLHVASGMQVTCFSYLYVLIYLIIKCVSLILHTHSLCGHISCNLLLSWKISSLHFLFSFQYFYFIHTSLASVVYNLAWYLQSKIWLNWHYSVSDRNQTHIKTSVKVSQRYQNLLSAWFK